MQIGYNGCVDTPMPLVDELRDALGHEVVDVVDLGSSAAVIEARGIPADLRSSNLDALLKQQALTLLASVDKDRSRSYSEKPATTVYDNYHDRVAVIASYRPINPVFERLCFQRPMRLYITPGKAVLSRPVGLDEEDDYQVLQRRVLPPFEYFNERVNVGLNDHVGGAMEVLGGMVEHLLEGGMVGYSLAFQPKAINGIWWMVPTEMMTYSGRQLAVARELTEFKREQWYCRRGQYVKQSEGSWNFQAWDETNYQDRNMWLPMVDEPESGVYRGVVKLDHPDGAPGKYPLPPYLPLLDSLLAHEMLTRDDLQTLAYNRVHLVLWVVDTDKCRAAGVPWQDVTKTDGTNVKGIVSYLKDARENTLQTNGGGIRETILPDFVSYQEHRPDFSVLLATEKYEPYDRQIELMSGLIKDKDGKIIAEESEEQKHSDFLFFRENKLENFVTNRIYEAIMDQNRRFWQRMNGVAWDDMFVFKSKKYQRLRGPKSILDLQKYRRRQVEIALDGGLEELRVAFQFAPSSARRDSRAANVIRSAERGLVSVESSHEVMGLDPRLERSRKIRQMEQDWVDTPHGESDVWSAPMAFVQRAVTDGQTVDTQHELSPGRPVDIGTEGDPDGTVGG